MNVALRNAAALPLWWQDPKMVGLVKRTAAKDCNQDEFDEFIAVCRELDLSPLRKQIYAFVFNKDDDKKRNMVLVIGIDGMRSISARGGLYRPDNKAPRWTINDALKNPLSNPLGIERCEVSIFTGHKLKDASGAERIEWNEVVGLAYWEEFAPIVKGGNDDDYEWVETGETWPDSGKPKKRKQLRQGVQAVPQLDPRKDGWRKSGRHMIAKCAEAIAHRKANPEPLSRVYADEEVDRAHVLDGVEYSDLTPSQMAAKADADTRLEKIGGPAILAIFAASGDLERVLHGQFADRVIAHTAKLKPAEVAAWTERNSAALNEFWAHSKTDCLALKKVLEARSGASGDAPRTAPASGSPSLAPDSEGRARGGKLSKDELIASINKLDKFAACLTWAENHRDDLDALDEEDRREVVRTFTSKQGALKRTEDAQA